ncbi:MAG: NYN domain-containing protein [Pirellulaceae bacterium]
MSLIIDGYNLLYAAGIGGQWETEDTFQQDRLALLESLRAVIDPRELSKTTVVFDSQVDLPHLPKVFHHREIEVRFSYGYPDADALIERMIQEHTAPKRLMVVSSDHKVQRAARRRKASTMDSDAWYRWMIRRRNERQAAAAAEPRPMPAVSEGELNQWLKFFGEIDLDELEELGASPTDPRWSTLPHESEPTSKPTPETTAPGKDSPAKDAGEGSREKPTESGEKTFSEEYLQEIINEFFQSKRKP